MSRNRNMNRIQRLTADIHKARERIAAEQTYIQQLQQQLAEVENNEIIRLVRTQNLSPLELHQMLQYGLPLERLMLEESDDDDGSNDDDEEPAADDSAGGMVEAASNTIGSRIILPGGDLR